jgi:hypothetical protein
VRSQTKQPSANRIAKRLNDAPPQRITKIGAAERQLIVAIDMFFRNGDSLVVYALAGAAREIISTMCERRGIKSFLDDALAANAGLTMKKTTPNGKPLSWVPEARRPGS